MSAGTTITVNPIPATPTISAGGTTTFCAGGSVVLTSSSAIGNQWYKDGFAIVNNGTGQTYTATVAGTYTVIVTSAGCSSAMSAGTTVTVNPAPVTPTISAGGSTTFCVGGSVVLTSSSATGNQWYKDGSLISGATNQTYTVSSAGTYTVITSSAGCSSAMSGGTTVTVNPTPSTPTISAGGATTFCAGGSVVLTSSSATGNQWYRDGVAISGAINQTYTSTAAGNYTVSVSNESGCSSASSVATTVIINAAAVAGSVSGASAVCIGTNSTTLTLSGNTGTIQWQSSTNNTTFTGIANATASTYTATNLTATTYYRALVTNGTCTATTSSVAITVNPIPAAPTGTPGSNCGAGVVTISATSTVVGATIEWYATTTSTAVLFTGATYTPNINATTTYYSAARLSGGCVSTRTAVVATINALPAVPTGTAGARCGTGTVVLGANAVAGTTVDWYATPTGGSVVAGGTGVTSFTTPSINATTTFYAQRRNTTTGCVSATRVPVVATINATPVTPTASDVSRCGVGTVTLSATAPTAPGATFAWFNVPSGGTALSTANPYTTASIGASTTYYVESRIATCVSSTRKAVVATVVTAPTGTAGSTCGTGTVTLSASTPFAGTIEWYLTNTSTAILGRGNTFTTPSISATTTYFAAVRFTATNCLSPRRAVIATVNPIPATPASITGTLSVCPISTTGYTFSTPNVAGVTYRWTLPSCAVATTNPQSTTNSIAVRFPGNSTADMMKVQIRSSTGCLSGVREVRVTNATNCTPCSAPVILTTNNNVKPDNPNVPKTSALDAKVFPNPSLGIFNLNVKSSSDEIIHVRVMNLSGKVLQVTQMTPSSTISVARDVIPGMYLIEIRQGDQLKTLKAVKL
jgi:hypothetical protein